MPKSSPKKKVTRSSAAAAAAKRKGQPEKKETHTKHDLSSTSSVETKVLDSTSAAAKSTKADNPEKAVPPSKKRRHSEVDESPSQKELAKKEAEWDKQLPEQYRKYRPKGYPLVLPNDPEKQTFRVYCDGIYDLFHLGHMNQLKQCKEIFPHVTLVVGVPADEITWKHKGLTVLTDTQRCETLMHCKWVDEVVPNAPWCVTPEFLEEHNVDFVAHDDIPYASADSDDVYAPVKKKGKFLVTQRTEGISTSDIITKIIRDYDKYLLRNFARGASRHDLNVSWFKKNELELKKHIDEFRQYFKKTNKNLNVASKDLYYEVREYLRSGSTALKRMNSSPSLSSFAGHFNNLGTNGSRSPSPSEQLSPAAEFAMKYTGNKNSQPTSIINSFRKWVFKREAGESGYSTDKDDKSPTSESESVSEDFVNLPKRKKQRTLSAKQEI